VTPVAKNQNSGGDLAKALLELFPSEPKKHFTLKPKQEKGQKDSSGGDMVKTYMSSIEHHILRHYEMFVATQTKGEMNSDLNLMDLIYYHTFGDYRMYYEAPKPLIKRSGGIKFQYKTLQFNPTVKSAYQGDPIKDILNRDETPGINYVYKVDAATKGHSYEIQDISWLNDELNEGSSGQRLMLPSIGTLMMTTYGYANINTELRKLIEKLLTKINKVLRTVKPNDDVLTYLVSAIKSDDRWAAVQTSAEAAKTLQEVLTESLDKESEGNWEDAVKHFATELIESTTSRYAVGEDIRISPKASLTPDEELELAEAVGDTNDYLSELFQVSGKDKNGKSWEYLIEYAGVSVPVKLKQKELLPTKTPSRYMEKTKKSFVAIPDPPIIVFYSILVDQMFALQAYLFTIKSSGKLNFGYLSPALTTKHSSELSHKFYPKMYSPTLAAQPNKKDYLKGKPKEKQSLLWQLMLHRNYYTNMILKTQRSIAQDTRVFDLFYNEDLTLKEVKWLSYALSDESKVLVKKPDKSDPLSQLVYFAPGAGEGVQLTGEADRRTAFYQIDIPMLKEVMLEYIAAFNNFTVTAAFSLESSDAVPKEGQIAKALWASIKKRSAKLLENNEAIPHEFFNNLFEEVKKSATDTSMGFDLYPPNWSDTNILSLLTVDPAQLNTLLTTEEYQRYLDEYLEYIYTRYGNRAGVASAIVTSLESYRIKGASDYSELREDFIKMLIEHETKKQIKSTAFVFRAYSVVIAIMRGQLGIPLSFREQAAAEGYERAALQAQLTSRPYGERGIAAVPPEHPLATLRLKKAEKEREEQELAKLLAAEEVKVKAEAERIKRIPLVTLVGVALTAPPTPPTDMVDASIAGNTTVYITGTGFSGDLREQPMTITFDGIDAHRFTVSSPTLIEATTPTANEGIAPGAKAVVEVTKSLRLDGGELRRLSSAKLDPASTPAQGLNYII